MRFGVSCALAALLSASVAKPAFAGSFDLFGIDTQYQLQATYAVGVERCFTSATRRRSQR